MCIIQKLWRDRRRPGPEPERLRVAATEDHGHRCFGPRRSGHNGIDGIYRTPDRGFMIVEGKYTGTASLNPATRILPRQMSDDWIRRPGELEKAIGDGALADLIVDSGYKRVLAKVAPDGSVTYRLIDSNGYVKRGGAGNFNP